jgi:hypothetical protein
MPWEGIRPNSVDLSLFTAGYNSSSLSFDVQSSAPDLTTVGSYNWGAGVIEWRDFQAPGGGFTECDSYYTLGIRVACQGLIDDYWWLDYSVDSGANWSSFIGSQGNIAATTITRSLSRTETPTYFQFRHNRDKAKGWDSSATFQIWDIFAVSSYTSGASVSRYPADTVDLTDSSQRTMTYVREIHS